MFSGIIEKVGIIESAGAEALLVRSNLFSEPGRTLRIGDSVSINGVCLSVVGLSTNQASFDLSSETLRKTTLGGLQPGAEVNIERSLRLGDSLDGHLVQGHVDAVAEVLRCDDEGQTTRVSLTMPVEVRDLIVPKGAVTLDGVSLTVGEAEQESFSVYLIPHTKAQTTFSSIQKGRLVNIEADCVARYVFGITRAYLDAREARG